MGVTIIAVDANDSIDIFDAREIDEEYGTDDPTHAGTYAISARDSSHGSGIAVEGTPMELVEWLDRARAELTRRIDADRAAAGTAGECGDCGAAVGVACEHPYCTGRLNPDGDGGVDDEDLDAVLRFEDFAEDHAGMDPDDRQTCHTCRAWATDEHLASEQHRTGVLA